eukprot:TRINITY_DN1736_c0_g3_i3.p1 TRINITY_DN1736_c0_g3~~TRINITY_DN1736_c0_g3_i3.p1  ORF type:complete len:218 (-),score=6.57 TRINITY_DN1736_c0_g3_i3:491-1096(-)
MCIRDSISIPQQNITPSDFHSESTSTSEKTCIKNQEFFLVQLQAVHISCTICKLSNIFTLRKDESNTTINFTVQADVDKQSETSISVNTAISTELVIGLSPPEPVSSMFSATPADLARKLRMIIRESTMVTRREPYRSLGQTSRNVSHASQKQRERKARQVLSFVTIHTDLVPRICLKGTGTLLHLQVKILFDSVSILLMK